MLGQTGGMGQTGGIGQSGSLGSLPVNNINSIIQQFGGLNNLARQLSGFLNKKGINAEQLVRQNIQGKTFSKETIEQFRAFAKQSGLSDEQINDGLRKIGVIK